MRAAEGAKPMLQASDQANIHVNIVGVFGDAFLHIDGWDFGAVNANHGRSLLGVSTSSGQTDLTVKNSKYDGNGAFPSLMSTSGTGKANITLLNCDFYAQNSSSLGLGGVATLDSCRITVKKTIASTISRIAITNSVITILEGAADTVINMSGIGAGSLQTFQGNVFIGPGGANKLMNYDVKQGTITVQNNIITGFGTVFDGTKAYAPSHNLLWQNTTVYAGQASDGGDNITADPDLDEDGRPGDESPAWGAGAITGLNHDIVGNARPHPGDGTESIGAYEQEYVAPPDPEPEPPEPEPIERIVIPIDKSMLSTFALDVNNDFVTDESGNLLMLHGIDAIAQTVKNYASTLQGEMILDIESGIPFFSTPLGRPNDLRRYEAFLRRRILQVPGITSIISLEASQVEDVVKYTVQLRTVYGEVLING
jgi:hypothetical protein